MIKSVIAGAVNDEDDGTSEDAYDEDCGSDDDSDGLGNLDSHDYASGESSVDLSAVKDLPDVDTPEAAKLSCTRSVTLIKLVRQHSQSPAFNGLSKAFGYYLITSLITEEWD
jgi:hypothetical protein